MLGIIMTLWEQRSGATSQQQTIHAALQALALGNPDLATALHNSGQKNIYSATHDGTILRIGALAESVIVAAMRGLKDRATLSGLTTHARLIEQATASPIVRLQFVTPTLFRHDAQSHCLPTPPLVFGGLLRQWVRTGGPRLPELPFGDVRTVRIDLQSQMVHNYGNMPEWGVTGTVWYEVGRHAHYYHALARFAEYSGVGARTAMGCGRVGYD